MITDCPNCSTKIAPGVVKCPKCAELFFENAMVSGPSSINKAPNLAASYSPASPPAQSKSEFHPESQEKVSPPYYPPKSVQVNNASIAEAIDASESKFKSKFLFWNVLMIWSVLLSFLAVFLVTRNTMLMNGMVDKSVADKFANSEISKTLLEVARKQGDEILKKQLEPAIKEFTKKIGDTAAYIDLSKERFDSQYELLARESALMAAKKNILSLAEQSQRGHRKSYDALVGQSERKDLKELAEMAQGEVLRVQNIFRLSNRLDGVSVNDTDASGQGIMNQALASSSLIKVMKESPSWKLRAKAAQLLGDRMETELPDLLLEVAATDPFLDVVKCAIESFSKITGYDGVETFGVKQAREWWQENRIDSGSQQEKEA